MSDTRAYRAQAVRCTRTTSQTPVNAKQTALNVSKALVYHSGTCMRAVLRPSMWVVFDLQVCSLISLAT